MEDQLFQLSQQSHRYKPIEIYSPISILTPKEFQQGKIVSPMICAI